MAALSGGAVHADAVDYDDEAIKRATNSPDIWLRRGNALIQLKHYEDAVADLDKAIALNPGSTDAWSQRGDALYELKRYDEALVSYETAARLKPEFTDTTFCAAFIRLLLGDAEGGWRDYEARWDTRQYMGAKRNFTQPLWLGGEEIAGKTILIHAEQGMGIPSWCAATSPWSRHWAPR